MSKHQTRYSGGVELESSKHL